MAPLGYTSALLENFKQHNQMIKIITSVTVLFTLLTCTVKNQTNTVTGNNNVPKVTETNQKTEKPLSDEDSLDLKIGQMIMIGINARTSILPTDTLHKEIKNRKMGGIILFEKNINPNNSKENLRKLIADIQASSTIPLMVSIDEEGGKVHRLKEKYGFVKMPSASYLGNLNNTDSTTYYTQKLASQLAELGITLNFAPDVDLATNPNNPVIAKANRSYSADPQIVTKHATASINAHHEFGVKTILKHFPGHGSSTTDSHLGITDVTNQWKFMELTPYNNIIKSNNCDAIMTAHIINCHLDTACLPATLSKTIVTDMLRNTLNYNGVVFSDDMQMFAISKNYGLENAIKLSINAGVDILLFGNQVNPQDKISASEVHKIIKKLVKSGDINLNRIHESYKRIMKLKGYKY
jgi:beta-N-acetylhexosaminidase